MPSISCHIHMSVKPASQLLDIMELEDERGSCTMVRHHQLVVVNDTDRDGDRPPDDRQTVNNIVNIVGDHRLSQPNGQCSRCPVPKKLSRCGVLASGSTICTSNLRKASRPNSCHGAAPVAGGAISGSTCDAISYREPTKDNTNRLMSTGPVICQPLSKGNCRDHGKNKAKITRYASAKQTIAALRDVLQLSSVHSSCGASTVAIDNKIEQAMDLVKSHLMYAVREEVLVLKEQIKELLEKNSQLEYENNVLRAGASPETLAKLSQTNPGQTQTSSS